MLTITTIATRLTISGRPLELAVWLFLARRRR